jgi:hypothetical protein
MALKAPFEKIFPSFSFRWRYLDGEYSPYAPFNTVTFFPKDPNIEDFFKKGHNTSMVNSVETINLQGISKGGPDVTAIDILYSESISSTIYILKTIEIPESERGLGEISVKVDKRSFGTALPNDQLLRQFDNVPLKAKSQEVTANRLMYGNYLHKYDQDINFAVETAIDTKSSRDNGPAVKSNRTYDIGVAYIDKYGRVGGLLSQKGSDIATEGSAVETEFSYTFRPYITAKIKSQAPSWAEYYRYYVKDVSGEHFNLSGFNIYNDGTGADTESDNVYVQFNSTDRNKISEDTVLIPRRHNFPNSDISNDQFIFTSESKHPILDIENEAPDIVKSQVIERNSVGLGSFKDIHEGSSTSLEMITSLSNTAGITGVTTSTSVIFLKDAQNMDMDMHGIPSFFNNYIKSQDTNPAVLFDTKDIPITSAQVVDMSGYTDKLVIELSNGPGNAANTQPGGAKSDRCLVTSVEYTNTTGYTAQRNCFKITLGATLEGEDFTILTAGTGFSTVPNLFNMFTFDETIKFFKLGLSEDGKEKLQGSFFVKMPRATADAIITQLPTGQTKYDEEGNVGSIKEINFETEPINDSNIDLYWESARTYKVNSDHGQTNEVDWANCISTVEPLNKKVYLESTKIFDKFNSVSIAKGIRVTTPEIRYAQERRKAGIIFSGLYNSKTGINELNVFNLAIGITKELEPNYGQIQKLYTLDTNLLAFTEDKLFRILADKDALFNADDGVNVVATNLVLGQVQAIQGNYGISKHPESFATFDNNIYFSDANRGAIMQYSPSNGQLFPISSLGLSNFFSDRLSTATKIIGAYDGAKRLYVVSIQGYNQNDLSIGTETILGEDGNLTIGYNPKAKGWNSRYSFIPESGLTLYNKFYTFKNGQAYRHNSDANGAGVTTLRNNFYGTQYDSQVQVIFNDNPGFVKDWLSLNYEGDIGWVADEILADQDENIVSNVRILDNNWFEKEGKFYGAISGTEPVYIIDPSGSPDGNGFYPLVQDGANTQPTAGTKGFFEKVRFKNSATTAKELFAISTEYYISQS